MKRNLGILIYALSDYLSAVLAWTGLFLYRKFYIEGIKEVTAITDFFDNNFYYGILLVPFFWLFIYFITGTYTDIFRKSRLREVNNTLVVSFIGTIMLFFLLLIDDTVSGDYRNYYRSAGVLFGLHFGVTTIGRLMVLGVAKSLVASGKIGYNTLFIGGQDRAVELFREITDPKKSLGYKLKGFVTVNGNPQPEMIHHLSNLGTLDQLDDIIREQQIDEVIIAIELEDRHKVNHILNLLADKRIIIKISPGIYEILSGSVKMTHITGAALIEIFPQLLPFWQQILKRVIDITASGLLLLASSPVMLFAAIRVRLSSPGPIFYRQTRIGKHGKPFKIYKFRSMVNNAEQKGPALSSDNDPRITPWGKIMRKWRIDELPQFWNVLKGDMSLVGPRPERQFFIDQLVEKAPEYRHLQKARPGITSWGMVKFGYAENVEEMLKRMKYDLLYIENMSLALDFKIMVYTVMTVLQGRGK